MFFKFDDTKPFLKIGVYQVGGQAINYFGKNFDTLIIGKILGSEILGGYDLAKQLVSKPIGLLNPILTKVATPSFSLIQNNKKLLKEKYLYFIKMGSSLSFLFYSFIIIFASVIVKILYGEEFQDITNLVRVLAIFYYLRSVFNYTGSLITALGRTDLDFYWNFVFLFFILLFVLIGSYYGIYGVAWSLVFAMLLSIYPYWRFLINKMIIMDFLEYLKEIIPSVSKLFYGLKKLK